MRDLDLLVPAVLVDPGLAPDLLRDQATPHLERIVAQAAAADTYDLPAAASLTSWQAWLFGARADLPLGRINLAELWAVAAGLPAATGGRFVAEPAHFTIANDHLRLDDPEGLAITLDESRALASSAEPVLAEAGWRLEAIGPATTTHWMLARDDGAQLSGAAIDKAIGDNVAAWQPRIVDTVAAPDGSAGRDGDAALAWRRCVNEIQMLWFGHPVNEAREARGQATINTLWLSGNGAPASELPDYAAVDSTLPLLEALPRRASSTRALETFDGFLAPVRREDWSGWRDALQRFDARLGEILSAQKGGSIGTLTMVLCSRDQTKVVRVDRVGRGDVGKALRRWLRKSPPIVDLLSEDPVGGAPS